MSDLNRTFSLEDAKISQRPITEDAERTYEFSDFCLDVRRRQLFAGDDPVPLAPKAFELLLALVRSRAHLVKKDDLMRILWPDTVVEESNLTQNIFQVRKALGETAHDHRFIVTVPGYGYRFIAEVCSTQIASAAVVPVSDGSGTSVAAVPFRVLGGAPGDEHLGLALADALITRLSNLKGITMRPTVSVMRYGAGTADPLAAGRELGVDTLVHGMIHRAGAGLRITAQIVNLAAAVVTWAGIIDQPLVDIFAAQDALGEQVARVLMGRLTDEERDRFSRKRGGSAETRRTFSRGRSRCVLAHAGPADGFGLVPATA